MERYLKETEMLDYNHPTIVHLVEKKGWRNFPVAERIGAIYDFVQNNILFGFNLSADDIKASQVLKDGIGQCNSKGVLMMALLRKCRIPCRLHGFTIDKELQKGVAGGFIYALAPRYLLHSWVEVLVDNRWINLEGYILDRKYLTSVQQKYSDVQGDFRGFAIATDDFKNPDVE